MTFKFVDALKFFFCLCVVAIHCDALNGLNSDAKYYATQGVFRLAVPYFFVASGFFLGKKAIENFDKIDSIYKKYMKRLIVPLVVFELINIALESLNMLPYMTGPFIFKEIIRHVVFYPWGALWFIQACIVGSFLLYPFASRKKFVMPVVMGSCLYVWALICNNYFFLVQDTPFEGYVKIYMDTCISARNGFFVGFVYLAIGHMLSQIRLNFNNAVMKCSMVLIFVLFILEIVCLKNQASLDDSALYLMQLFFVPMLFLVSTKINIGFSSRPSKMLRDFSIGVYLLHRPILSFFELLGLNYLPNFGLWLIVVIVCLGICYLAFRRNGLMKKILS